MPEILLIGVNHLDITAPEKLAKVLEDFSPDTILLEGSESKFRAQEIYIDELRRLIREGIIPEIQGEIFLEDQEIRRYEARTAMQYGEGKDVDIDYLNDSFERLSPGRIREEVQRIYTQYNDHPNPEKLREVVMTERSKVKVYMKALELVIKLEGEEKAVKMLSPRNHIHVGDRDGLMEKALRSKLEGKRLCSITGLNHILRNEKNNSLFCRIEDLNPGRKFLW